MSLHITGYERTEAEGVEMTTEHPLQEKQLGEKSNGGTIGEKLLRMWREENMKLQIYRIKTAGTNRLKEEQWSEVVTSV
jgi:hypothetical protein